MEKLITRLEHHCTNTYSKLLLITQSDFEHKPSSEKWSKKEILGHLIDSAANNHQRFIRAQYQDTPHIVYDQNHWVSLSNYQHYPLDLLIEFWRSYNLHIVHVLKNMPASSLDKKCETSGGKVYTLEYLIVDYLSHLEHHLSQILAP